MESRSVLLLSLMVFTTAVVHGADISVFDQGLPDTCLKGPLHKPTPSPQSDAFLECRSWKKQACCNVNVSHEIHHNRAEGIYNFFWDKCEQLSPECEQYLKNEECFYQCEPMLKHYERPGQEGYIRDVPICKSYCEKWFDACKDDLTCVKDWLADWHFEDNGLNHCPANSQCIKFSDMYGDARGLCDKMWGDAFFYEASDQNCMAMYFDPDSPTNPNINGFRNQPNNAHQKVFTSFVAYVSAMSLYLILFI